MFRLYILETGRVTSHLVVKLCRKFNRLMICVIYQQYTTYLLMSAELTDLAHDICSTANFVPEICAVKKPVIKSNLVDTKSF